jgi:hypothetical protein
MRLRTISAAAAALMLATGCSGSDPHEARTPPAGHTTHSVTPAPRSATSPFRVGEWGVNDGMLSVLVENTGRDEITSAHAIITARDANGTIIASVSGASGALCCTIVGLQPRHSFGLYADFGPGVTRTASVAVDYTEVTTRAPAAHAPSVTASRARLQSASGQTLVHVDLSAPASVGPYVAVQAVLQDPSGKLVAVISGRFYCLFPGSRLGATLQLFHPVAAGTVVRAVTASTIPTDLPAVTAGLPSCTDG